MEWQSVLQILIHELKNTSILKENIKREDELMLKLWNDHTIKELIHLWLKDHYNKKSFKCIRTAQSFKTIGNEQFRMKQYSESIQSYTKCALYAPADSCELSIAFANRSAALFYLNRHNDCIKDIELAINLNYPKELRHKIYLRATQCYLKLGKQQLAEEMLFKLQELIKNPISMFKIREMIKEPLMKDDIPTMDFSFLKPSDASVQFKKQTPSNLAELKSHSAFEENDDFPNASTSIDMKYSKQLGRHVVANRLIRRGEILFLEKPVSFILVNYHTLSDSCQHCNCLNTDIPVPCTTCLYTCYCSGKCLNEAWSSYHCWECPGSEMNLWKEIGIGHLALKVLLTCSTTTDMIKFNEMQNLMTNFDKVCIDDLVLHGITAIMLTIYLLEYTNFFEINNLEDCLMKKFSGNAFNINFNILIENDKQLYVSSLLLRHILQLVVNAHAISRTNILSNKNYQADIVASGIYPSASMMNHSCDPNIINIFRDQYLIVRASRDILTNEEVFNCYGPHYRHMRTEKRQQILKSQYCFTCKCNFCTLPELQYFMDTFDTIKCLKCDNAMLNINYHLNCIYCNKRLSKNYHQSEIIQAEQLFKEARKSIDLGKMDEALKKLNKCLCIRKEVLYKYNKDITSTLRLMAEIHIGMGQWKDAIAYLYEAIVAVRERFGFFSTEHFNELNILTDTYLTYLQKELNVTTDKAMFLRHNRDMLSQTGYYFDQLIDIADLNYGSWSKVYEGIIAKQKIYASFYI